jgi:hypothetical protein
MDVTMRNFMVASWSSTFPDRGKKNLEASDQVAANRHLTAIR